jgi:hypothetical protein
MTCDRCGGKSLAYVMSYFTIDMLCFDCKNDEKGAPNYQKAYDAETAAVKNRNFNFPGIGIAPEDQAYFDERVKLRTPPPSSAL